MPLLDAYLPVYQFREYHRLRVTADASRLRAALDVLPQWQDPLVRRLIALREAPARLAARLGGRNALPQRPPFGLHQFTPLQATDCGVVYGLAGQFWRADYGLLPLADAAAFAAHHDAPRLALAFSIVPQPGGGCLLSTETRLQCPDRASYRRMLPYWLLIRPVSGLIRRRALRALARLALAD